MDNIEHKMVEQLEFRKYTWNLGKIINNIIFILIFWKTHNMFQGKLKKNVSHFYLYNICFLRNIYLTLHTYTHRCDCTYIDRSVFIVYLYTYASIYLVFIYMHIHIDIRKRGRERGREEEGRGIEREILFKIRDLLPWFGEL